MLNIPAILGTHNISPEYGKVSCAVYSSLFKSQIRFPDDNAYNLSAKSND